MPDITSFCHEILHDILCEVNPADLGALSQTCQTFYSFIKNNRLLWKDVYLRHFDNPPRKALEDEVKWEEELQSLVAFQKLMETDNEGLKRDNIAEVCTTAAHLLHTASPDQTTSLNTQLLTSLLHSPQNSDIFLFSSSLYAYAGSTTQIAASTEPARQLSAKLHSYYGTSLEAPGRTRARESHPFARSKVYDLRNYTDENLWGPFKDDGSMETDWEKVEAVLIVLGHNLQLFAQRCSHAFPKVWNAPFGGAVPNSYKPLPRCCDNEKTAEGSARSLVAQPEPPLEAMDPYGVTGTWRRVVCFLDYNDLYHFNFSTNIPDGEPRPPINIQEAVRLITMKLRVTRLEQPGEEDGKALPIVHFTGTSRSMHASWDPNANSRLRGTVRTTPSGDIRWTTLSVFHGEARWRSESVQVGGLRSGRGVIGTWFDKDFDPNGPAGPTAFWKLTDEVGAEDGRDGEAEEMGIVGLPAIFA